VNCTFIMKLPVVGSMHNAVATITHLPSLIFSEGHSLYKCSKSKAFNVGVTMFSNSWKWKEYTYFFNSTISFMHNHKISLSM